MTTTPPRPSDYYDIEVVINNQRAIMQALLTLLHPLNDTVRDRLNKRLAIIDERDQARFGDYPDFTWNEHVIVKSKRGE